MSGQSWFQVLLYVGEAPLRMESELRGDDVWFRYRVFDIRELDGERLLESEDVGDNVIAILARLRDHKEAVRKIVGKIAGLAAAEREAAFSQLLILAGLRRLEETVAREIREMPVYIDLLENKVLGPAFRRGELTVLRRLIEKRFGAMPSVCRLSRLPPNCAAERSYPLRLGWSGTTEQFTEMRLRSGAMMNPPTPVPVPE